MSVLSSSDVWLDAFHRQATSKMISLGRRHARWCLFEYRLDRSEDYEREVVIRALGDILDKKIQWDPARASLLDQVCDVVRYRIRDEKRSPAEKRIHEPIGPTDRDRFSDETKDGSQKLEAEVARAAIDAPDDPEALLVRKQERELGARVGAALAALVAEGDDPNVAAIFGCWRSGTSERKDILAETGMTADAYHDARRRLLRLVGRLPVGLRTKA